MLNFIFWGITLNCYAFTMYALALYSLSPLRTTNKKQDKAAVFGGGYIYTIRYVYHQHNCFCADSILSVRCQ